MGPKKKGGAKKGGGDKKEDAALNKGFNPPPAFIVSRQMDQEKIDALGTRVGELLDSNNALRTSSTRNEKDTHDIVLYFQRELEVKDDLIQRLHEELATRETQLKFEVDRITHSFETKYRELDHSTSTQIDQLTTQLGEAERELVLVDQFKREKDSHVQLIAALKEERESESRENQENLDLVERKFLEDKAAFLREVEKQKIAFREIALKEAKQMMGSEMQNLIKDNSRMHEELKFNHNMAVSLQKDKDGMDKNLARALREVAILTDKEDEYARQGLLKTKEIKALRDRVEILEKQQIVNIERFRHRTKELKSTVHKELEDATLDASGLRRLIKIKNKELRHMKSLAATILSQRSEVEQFFLESLDEVKNEIRKEKRKEKLALLTANTKGLLPGVPGRKGQGTSNGKTTARGPVTSGLPQINLKGSQQQYLEERDPSNLPLEDEKVALKELKWSDKELVLRVLFAKMNGLQDSVNSAVQQSRVREAPAPTGPVFATAGAGMGMTDEDIDAFQDMFEVPGGGDDDYGEDGMGMGMGLGASLVDEGRGDLYGDSRGLDMEYSNILKGDYGASHGKLEDLGSSFLGGGPVGVAATKNAAPTQYAIQIKNPRLELTDD